MRYRPDIDGLRTVAVTLVILNHVDPKPFIGGFIGVDVFFVISGYLITGDIARRLSTGTFLLADFYERRFRRIVPALTAMLIAASILAYMILLPEELQRFAHSLIAATCCYANLFYAATQEGYFGLHYSNLLIHTWSLGVEEQFYLVIPLCMILAAKWKKSIKPFFIGALIVSFVAAAFMTLRQYGQPFYMPYSRAWELLAGSMLAFGMYPRLKGRPVNTALAIASVVGLCLFTIFYVPAIPFPGIAALPACLVGVLLIATGEGEGTVVSRMLSLRPMTFVGQISYSLYLWHWPVIVAVRLGVVPGVSDHSMSGYVFTVGLSLILATLSYYFVELPFRSGRFKSASKQRIFTLTFASMALLSLVGFGLTRHGGLTQRFTAHELQVAAAFHTPTHLGAEHCFIEGPLTGFDQEKCLHMVPDKPNILLFGDSHAAALWAGLHHAFPEANLMQATAATCHPTLGAYGSSPCSQFRRFMFEEYFSNHHPDAVILSERWGGNDKPLDLLPAVKFFQDKGIRVIVIGPGPEYTAPLPVLLALGMKLHRVDYVEQDRTSMANDVDPILQQALSGMHGVQYVSIVNVLCPSRHCLEYADQEHSIPLLFDVYHLSPEASIRLFESLREQLVLGL